MHTDSTTSFAKLEQAGVLGRVPMDVASMLIAAYCQRTGTALDTLASYL
ncbi:hypothetical protein AB0D62_36065 [Streptomyces massasporeus]